VIGINTVHITCLINYQVLVLNRQIDRQYGDVAQADLTVETIQAS
jgi:hypothetical protein